MRVIKSAIVAGYLVLAALPLVWLGLTSIKTNEAAISPTARFVPKGETIGPHTFRPTIEGYRRLATANVGAAHDFYHFLGNSVVIS